MNARPTPLKIHVVSDLHLESAQYHIHRLDVPVIVLAGDIGVGMLGLEWAAEILTRFEGHIIYLCGNHEFYRNDIGAVKKAMRDFCSPPKGWSGDDSQHRLHYAENDEVIIQGTRFLCGTLWTDFEVFGKEHKAECMIKGSRALNDFRLIKNGDRIFTVQDSIELHEESVRWLERKLKDEPFDGPTVVVTHHCPTWESVAPRYRENPVTACFASRLDHLMGFSELWIHGHTHDSMDYMFKGTRVICNPRGYSRYEGSQENHDFNPNLVFEVSKGKCVISEQAFQQPEPSKFWDPVVPFTITPELIDEVKSGKWKKP